MSPHCAIWWTYSWCRNLALSSGTRDNSSARPMTDVDAHCTVNVQSSDTSRFHTSFTYRATIGSAAVALRRAASFTLLSVMRPT